MPEAEKKIFIEELQILTFYNDIEDIDEDQG
jgi:hypothetical protein